jgi:ABC-type antimicrobial peptide transport system permease subunit
MIRLGLRLTLKGGKEAAVRLAVTSAAVAIGVCLLLTALSGMHAISAQNTRAAWLNSGNFGPERGPAAAPSAPSSSSAQPLWWLLGTDSFGDQTIFEADIAATGPSSPVPPGIPQLPGPGQYYGSPALTRLIRSTPASELGNRFTGQQIGTIGQAGLPSPTSLIIVVGYSAQDLAKMPGADKIGAFNTDPNVGGPATGVHNDRLKIILAVGVAALLLPMLVFIATATRLAAARREQRFAAMRLVGATPRQITVISTVEACMAALFGALLGIGLFYGVHPALANLDFTGQRLASGDLSPGRVTIVVVALGVPVAAAISARIAMRRAQISPLGVLRRVTPPSPRAYRLAPLIVGLAELLYFVAVGHPSTTGRQVLAYFTGGVLIIVGLLIAGPWMTMVGARAVARHARRPSTLLAGRRLADNPGAAFRTISGLIIALFVASATVGVLTTILSYRGTAKTDSSAHQTLIADISHPQLIGIDGQSPPQTSAAAKVAVPPALLGELTAIPGVHGATVVYSEPGSDAGSSLGLVACSQLSHTPAIGRCAAGAQVADLSGLDPFSSGQQPSLSGHVWPPAAVTTDQLAELSARAIVVQTNGSTASLEQARTALELAFPGQSASTFSEISANVRRTVTEMQQIAKIVIVASLVIAGCSLSVSVVAGIADRKRPFSLLMLAGTPLRVLRRMVLLEAAVPLVVIAVLSTGLGLLAAGLFLHAQLDYALRSPGAGYYVLVVGGIVASLAIIAATVPLIQRIAGPDIARNE